MNILNNKEIDIDDSHLNEENSKINRQTSTAKKTALKKRREDM